VGQANGLSRTVIRGIAELKTAPKPARGQRIRREGAGRKRTVGHDATLKREDLEFLVEPVTRGHPETPLRWTCKSVRQLAAELDGGGDVIERYVNASEIANYVFCPKAWQLSQIGAPSQNTSEQGEGIDWHAAHSDQFAGAERSGRLIWRIRFRVSWETGGRPGWPRRSFQVQNSRNPLRCQSITVSGFHHDQGRAPAGPESRQPAPEKSISRGQLRSLHRALQNVELMPKSEHLDLKSCMSAKAIPRRCQNGH
jgi:hypothetical protein